MLAIRSCLPRLFAGSFLIGCILLALGAGCLAPSDNGSGDPAPSDTSPAQTVPDTTGNSGAPQSTPEPARGDLNGDGAINQADFDILAAAFGSRQGDSLFNPAADLNGDGAIGLADVQILDSLAKGLGG